MMSRKARISRRGGNGDEDVQMDQHTTEQLQSSHGPFSPPPTWSILPKPAADEAPWTDLKQGMKANCKFWKGKQLAHIFDDGWDLGPWGFSETRENSLGFQLQ